MVLFLLLLYASQSFACNCVFYAIEALQSVHLRLKTIPSIAENDFCKHTGCYAKGVVFIRDIDDCQTMIHEFVHHAQWLKYGDASDLHENWRRELQAAAVTMNAIAEYGACK